MCIDTYYHCRCGSHVHLPLEYCNGYQPCLHARPRQIDRKRRLCSACKAEERDWEKEQEKLGLKSDQGSECEAIFTMDDVDDEAYQGNFGTVQTDGKGTKGESYAAKQASRYRSR